MTSHTIPSPAHSARRGLNIALWVVQALLFLAFVVFGIMKMFMPVDHLAALWVWPGQLPAWFLRSMGLIDAAGGVGILLPALTRIKPQLTVVAALGLVALQLCAIVFHVSRGEAMNTPLNVVLLGLSAFVLWGRGKAAPFAS